jgi:TRAP-type mannitol/chloroaromatic compound transport system substrate-binding protein
VGTGAAQAMTTNSAQATSFYDGFTFCNLPAQLYIGGFYRNTTNTGAATVTATSPANLINGAGDTIPFTQISWTSSGNGDAGAQPFPAGAFVGGVQTIGTISRNQWAESCHTFSYANSNIRPAGTYTGRVTYTLSSP